MNDFFGLSWYGINLHLIKVLSTTADTQLINFIVYKENVAPT